MRTILPPLLFLLALAALISAFAMIASGEPEEGIELHRARVEGDDAYVELLEHQLERRQWTHYAVIGALFGSAVLFTIAGFVMMGSARSPR